MRVASAKAKGRRLAKQVKELMLTKFNVCSDDINVTSSGCTGEDLQLSPLCRSMLPISVECKNQERLNIWQALKQSESHTDKYTPVLVFSRNKAEIYCCLKLDKLLDLYKEIYDLNILYEGGNDEGPKRGRV